MRKDINVEYAGRWDSVLTALGMFENYFKGKHGNCPSCGNQGKNARWHKTKHYNVCSKCGVTQPMQLAMMLTGEDFKSTAKRIRGEEISMEPAQKKSDIEKDTARLKAIYARRKSITSGCVADQYFKSRGLSVLPKKDVFTILEADYWTEENGKFSKEVMPAIVSVIRNSAGETVSYHMTYIKNGQKHGRKVLPPIRSMAGAAIQLFDHSDGLLGVSEGIETALAVHQIEGLPMWAAGNAWQMEVMEIPEEIKELHIYADNDKTFTGQKSAYILANKMALKGIDVYVHQICTGSWIVDKGGSGDFLDHLIRTQKS